MRHFSIRIEESIAEAIENTAKKDGLSINKKINQILQSAVDGEVNIADRLDKYETAMYELQFMVSLQSSFFQESMRVLFTRTNMIIDMLKTAAFKYPDVSTELAKAKEDIEKVVKKSIAEVQGNIDIWHLDKYMQQETNE